MLNLNTLSALRCRPLNTVAALSVVSLILLTTSSSALAHAGTNEFDKDADHSIEGSWICKIDRISLGDSFTALMSFTAGGVVLATGSLDKLNPISPIYGSWKQTGHNRVAVTIYFFLFDPLGNPVGMLKTNETFRLNGQNKLVGSGSSFVCDVDGQNCSNHGSEALIGITGNRILPEGLQN
jgi:hypothetical protein